jgi:hypothetical protein
VRAALVNLSELLVAPQAPVARDPDLCAGGAIPVIKADTAAGNGPVFPSATNSPGFGSSPTVAVSGRSKKESTPDSNIIVGAVNHRKSMYAQRVLYWDQVDLDIYSYLLSYRGSPFIREV